MISRDDIFALGSLVYSGAVTPDEFAKKLVAYGEENGVEIDRAELELVANMLRRVADGLVSFADRHERRGKLRVVKSQ